MLRHMHSIYLVTLAASSAVMLGGVAAAQSALAFPPPAPGITVTMDVEYGMAGTTRLAMDVYKPAQGRGTEAPAVVFFNRATGAERSGRFYSGWARTAASKG
jgi:hypothetical protein